MIVRCVTRCPAAGELQAAMLPRSSRLSTSWRIGCISRFSPVRVMVPSRKRAQRRNSSRVSGISSRPGPFHLMVRVVKIDAWKSRFK